MAENLFRVNLSKIRVKKKILWIPYLSLFVALISPGQLDARQKPMNIQQVTLEHSDGRHLVVTVYPSAASLKKDVLIFVPGTGAYSDVYRYFLNLLSKSYNVIAIDPTGHGRTVLANGENTRGIFTGEDLYQDVHLTITYAIKKFGPNIGLIGTSQGGEIVARAMVRDPRIQASVVHGIFDTAVSKGVNSKQRLATILPLSIVKKIVGNDFDFRKQLDWEGDLYLGAGYGSTFTNSFIEKNGRPPTDEERKAAIVEALEERFNDPLTLKSYKTESYKSLLEYDWWSELDWTETMPDPLTRYQGPVLLITADNDKTVTPRFISSVGKRMTSPHKKIVILKNTYHQLPMHNTNEFLDEILPFFKTYLK